MDIVDTHFLTVWANKDKAHRPSNKTPRRCRERPGLAIRGGNLLQNAKVVKVIKGPDHPLVIGKEKKMILGPKPTKDEEK